jgi:FkbM family methyltransferase
MHKIFTFIRYLKDYLQYGQIRLVVSSIVFLVTRKSVIETRICRGKLGYFLHRKGTLDFQFGNFAYEWPVKKFFLDYYKDRNVFIDVGANMGTYTLMMQNFGIKTFSFEPAKANYKALTINLMLNNHENNAVVYNLGLGSKKSHELFVFDPINTGASHMNSVAVYDHDTDGRGKMDEVDLVMLDEMIETMAISLTDRIMIKIDVEGMEKDVLLGAKEFMKKYSDIILVIESVHSGEQELKYILDQMAVFEYIKVDKLNFAAKKINNL